MFGLDTPESHRLLGQHRRLSRAMPFIARIETSGFGNGYQLAWATQYGQFIRILYPRFDINLVIIPVYA